MASEPCQILVIEDYVPLGHFIKRALDGAGWAVVGPITEYAAAMVAARQLPLSLVVMDRMLQDQETFTIADAVTGRGIPCLMISGYPRATLPQRFQDLPFLAKPFTMEALFDAVRVAVRGGS